MLLSNVFRLLKAAFDFTFDSMVVEAPCIPLNIHSDC